MVRQWLRQLQENVAISYNWIPLYLMQLFTLCGSGSSCGNGNASKWVLTLFLQLRQWQTNTVVTVICHCRKCSCEHFHVIVAEKPLPLPHRVNGPLRSTSTALILTMHLTGVYGVCYSGSSTDQTDATAVHIKPYSNQPLDCDLP